MNATIEVGGLVDIIGTITMEFFSLVNVVIICSILAVSGLVANVINLCVFYRHGLNNSMNISFFALTMTMLINLLFLLWRVICVYPFMDRSGFPIVFNEIKLLTAGWPNVCVNRVVSWITVYITAERCFSITIPLKVKLVFTSRRAVVVLVLIYVINFMTLIPEYCVLYLDWKFFPSQNKTIIGLVYRTNRPPLEGLTSGLNAIFTVTAFIGMIIFTSILIKVLKQKSKWRRKAMPDKDKTESFSTRQKKKTVTMVIALACVMIACYTNSVFVTSVAALVPEFSAYGETGQLVPGRGNLHLFVHRHQL
ncbi:uncharacterized protein LOC131957115 [Physella acuta]|uniref:uncharacterized protein LOC131957115 n=1 Tax=Physella acuta TaxID=109671 RepID=UPI0027DB84B4|nr:uncharacterized protein LOC131957115 [Physella acuta]